MATARRKVTRVQALEMRVDRLSAKVAMLDASLLRLVRHREEQDARIAEITAGIDGLRQEAGDLRTHTKKHDLLLQIAEKQGRTATRYNTRLIGTQFWGRRVWLEDITSSEVVEADAATNCADCLRRGMEGSPHRIHLVHDTTFMGRRIWIEDVGQSPSREAEACAKFGRSISGEEGP